MKKVNELHQKTQRPIKIIQFGEGNFLRGFVDYMVDVANERGTFDGSVAVVKPIAFGSLEAFREQNGVYTLVLRGRMDGKTLVETRVITAIDRVVDAQEEYADYMALARLPDVRFVVSNTTEAGIVYDDNDRFELKPPHTYPGKLTQFLYERFKTFGEESGKGVILLPVELIEDNGGKLHDCVRKLCVLWELEPAFSAWIERECVFCSTLVDRIITGYPRTEAEKLEEDFGYTDKLIDTGEPFALWVIESTCPKVVEREFPLNRAGLPVVFTKDQRPYRERKVRILNGAHTSSVLAAYLAGFDYVGDCMNDAVVRAFMEKAVHGEIMPTVQLPADEVRAFADSVFERFQNPFIQHSLLSISLNSVSKWKSRVLPSLLDSLHATGVLPACLTFSFAALAAFYTSGVWKEGELYGCRAGMRYDILDDAPVLAFFGAHLQDTTDGLVAALAGETAFWGQDLRALPGFCKQAAADLQAIRTDARQALAGVLEV